MFANKWSNHEHATCVWRLEELGTLCDASSVTFGGLKAKLTVTKTEENMFVTVQTPCWRHTAATVVVLFNGGVESKAEEVFWEDEENFDRRDLLSLEVGLETTAMVVYAFVMGSQANADDHWFSDVVCGWDSSSFTDCFIKLADGEIESYGFLLAYMSPFLRSRLALSDESGVKCEMHGNQPVIDLADYQTCTFYQLYHANYHRLPAFQEVDERLAMLANYLMCADVKVSAAWSKSHWLQSFCDYALASTLTLQNVAERALLANRLSLPALKDATQTFIRAFFCKVLEEHEALVTAHADVFLRLAGDVTTMGGEVTLTTCTAPE